MTLIFKECGKRSKPLEDEFVVALDARTKRVILYNKKLKNPGKIDIPMVGKRLNDLIVFITLS